MPEINGLGWTFDTVVSTYEKFRPGYVDELYRMIFAYVTLNDHGGSITIYDTIDLQLARKP